MNWHTRSIGRENTVGALGRISTLSTSFEVLEAKLSSATAGTRGRLSRAVEGCATPEVPRRTPRPIAGTGGTPPPTRPPQETVEVARPDPAPPPVLLRGARKPRVRLALRASTGGETLGPSRSPPERRSPWKPPMGGHSAPCELRSRAAMPVLGEAKLLEPGALKAGRL